MKLALFQTQIIWESKEKNICKVSDKLEELKEKGVEIFFLPEMSFTGFSMNVKITQEDGEETVSAIRELCLKYGIAIGFGWVKKGINKAENHYTIINKEGIVISDYVKIHPFSYSNEDLYFQGGTEIVFFEMDNIVCSTFICYDLRFPEIFQIASKKAHVIIVPANWPAKREAHWKALLQARAIENQVYIVAINCVGDMNGEYYSGNSCIIGPDGEVLDNISDKESIIIYELNNDVDKYRDLFPMKKDRNEELYSKMIMEYEK